MLADKNTRNLSSAQIRFLEWKERETLARKDREQLADFNAEERALYADPDATQTFSGKAILRHGSIKSNDKENDPILRALDFFASAGQNPGTINLQYAKGYLNGVASLAGPFGATAAVPAAKIGGPVFIRHEDEEYVYDTARVDPDTQEKLDAETAIIESKILALQSIEDPKMHEQMALEIIREAEEFEMRPHPITKRYVHNIDRVEREMKLMKVSQAECTGTVCVFRVKAEIGDVKGVKRHIGDQFNQDPVEVIASGDHLKVEAPANPVGPQLRHS